MTTLLLPPDEVAKIRALKGLAYVLAVMILLDRNYPGRGFAPKEVALIAGLDERTVSKQLMDLSVLDRVILTGAGYVLTQGGRALFLAPAGDDQALALSPVSAPEQALSPEPVNGQALEAQALNVIDAAPAGPAPCTHTARALEVSKLTLIAKENTHLTYLDTQLAQKLNPKVVFGKSYLLFGESVTKRDISVDGALAIFAHVYESRDRFQYPARVAYAMMRDNKEPREEIAADPWKHLPAKYLEALDIVRYECRYCSEKFSTVKALEEHLQAAHPVKETYRCDECGAEFDTEAACEAHWQAEHAEAEAIVDERADKAWKSVLAQLKTDMHQYVFDTWLKDTKAIRFEGEDLIIGTRNSATREWLESRIRSTVERLLIGILNQSVKVSFVVSENLL